MFRAGIIACLAMFLIAAAPIQQLQPAQHRAEHSNKEPNDAYGKNHRTKNPPPSATAAPGYIDKTSADAATRAAYKAGKHDGEGAVKWTDRAIVGLTLGLVIAALLQFGAALLQWNAMRRQEQQMRRSIIEGRRASNRQSREVQAQIALARDEFASTHRPRFKVRKITFSQLTPDVPISGHCDVVNVGDMPGKLVEYSVEIVCGTPGERYEYWLPNPKNVRQFNTPLAVGESGTIWFTDGRDLPQSMYDAIKSRNMVAYVFGYVGYTDGAKLRRNTGFLRWYDASYVRFRTINDPDYEYED